MEVPLWKNLDSLRIRNPLIFYANPMPIKRKPPLTGDSKVSEGAWVIWVGYILPQHTLPAEHLTTREIEATTLFLLVCSEDVVEAVAEKYDAWKDKADCHTYNECKYVARKEHSEPPVFYLVGNAKPMPIWSGRWAAWGGVGKKTRLMPRSLFEKWISPPDPRYGCWVSRGKVWIKVCDLEFRQTSADFRDRLYMCD